MTEIVFSLILLLPLEFDEKVKSIKWHTQPRCDGEFDSFFASAACHEPNHELLRIEAHE